MKVICISGTARSGKDTSASIMSEYLTNSGQNNIITHNADLLKYICKQFFGWNGVKDEQGRTILQYVGTEVVRERKPSFWVDFLINMADLFGSNWDYMIVSDARFPNEIQGFKDAGFDTYHIRIMRDGYDSGLTETQKNHPSEIALNDVIPDYIIKNNGSVDELKLKIENVLCDIGVKKCLTKKITKI